MSDSGTKFLYFLCNNIINLMHIKSKKLQMFQVKKYNIFPQSLEMPMTIKSFYGFYFL